MSGTAPDSPYDNIGGCPLRSTSFFRLDYPPPFSVTSRKSSGKFFSFPTNYLQFHPFSLNNTQKRKRGTSQSLFKNPSAPIQQGFVCDWDPDAFDQNPGRSKPDQRSAVLLFLA